MQRWKKLNVDTELEEADRPNIHNQTNIKINKNIDIR